MLNSTYTLRLNEHRHSRLTAIGTVWTCIVKMESKCCDCGSTTPIAMAKTITTVINLIGLHANGRRTALKSTDFAGDGRTEGECQPFQQTRFLQTRWPVLKKVQLWLKRVSLLFSPYGRDLLGNCCILSNFCHNIIYDSQNWFVFHPYENCTWVESTQTFSRLIKYVQIVHSRQPASGKCSNRRNSNTM